MKTLEDIKIELAAGQGHYGDWDSLLNDRMEDPILVDWLIDQVAILYAKEVLIRAVEVATCIQCSYTVEDDETLIYEWVVDHESILSIEKDLK